MKQIKVLVSSCACNQKYVSLVEAVVKNNQIDATIEKVDDIMKVMQYNVMSLPALVVDGEVDCPWAEERSRTAGNLEVNNH